MNRSLHGSPRLAIVIGALLATTSFGSLAAPRLATGTAAEVTFDGLHRVDDAAMDAAWVKPNLDLGHYRKLMLLPAGMSFKDADRHSTSEFPLSEKQKQQLRDTVLAVFVEELGKLQRFELTDRPGRDVLQVRGAILDVVSHVPPDPVGRGGFVLKSLGEATLVVELRDSMSDEILARAVDRRSASSTLPRRSNAVTNLAEVRSAARRWAAQLRQRLEEFAAI